MPDAWSDLHEEIIERILAADRSAAVELIKRWAKTQTDDLAAAKLVEAVLMRIGQMWHAQRNVSLAHAYVAAKVAEDVLEDAAFGTARSGVEIGKGPIVLGNAEDDYHSLGRRLVVSSLRAANWRVVDLGNDVLAVDFVDQAVEVGAKVIGVSAMMYPNAANIRRVREEIDKRHLTGRLQLAVGGAVFVLRPELVEKVGGDGTACNAMETPQLIESLWDRATSREEAR